MATEARYNPKVMVMEHRHGKFGWHWASARHPKDPTAHQDHDAGNPSWDGEGKKGPSREIAKMYQDALGRVVVTHIRETHPHLARFQKDGEAEDEETEEADFALNPS